MKRFIAFVLVGIMLFSLNGCGKKKTDFNAKGYVQAVLDAKFHRQYKDYAAVVGVTEKEAKEQMESEFRMILKDYIQEFSTQYGMTEEEMDQYIQLEADARAKVEYKVKKAVKSEDGNYTVSVEITPYPIYDKLDAVFQTKWTTAAQNGATEEQCKTILLESFKECVKSTEAAEVVTFTFHVIGEQKGDTVLYGISEDEMKQVDLMATGQEIPQ